MSITTTGVLLITLAINGQTPTGPHRFCAVHTETQQATCSRAVRSVALTLQTGRYVVKVDGSEAGKADVGAGKRTEFDVRRVN